jgi:hypothetical protein
LEANAPVEHDVAKWEIQVVHWSSADESRKNGTHKYLI